jgi:beta-N-acetylhexosaminidase
LITAAEHLQAVLDTDVPARHNPFVGTGRAKLILDRCLAQVRYYWVSMDVENCIANVFDALALSCSKVALEHVPFDLMYALNEQCSAPQDRLHDPTEWRGALEEKHVQVVVHYRVRDQPSTPRSDSIDDKVFDFSLHVRQKPGCMALGAADNMKGRSGLVGSKSARHTAKVAGGTGHADSGRWQHETWERRPMRYGHHFAIGLQPSPRLTDHDRQLLTTLNPAGVILFRPNFDHDAPYDEWRQTLKDLLADVRSCIDRDHLLIGIDHEGGRVIRTPAPVTHFAYAREWPAQAANVGRAMAIELRSLGMNCTFAPVVDVDSNPANPVIGARAFASGFEQVTAAALDFIRAVEAEGLLTCPKHFPGHGDTAVDSHHGLPVVEHDLTTLRDRELRPFKATIDAGARMIMTSHIVFPKIDPGVPATMSRRIIKDILRDDLGFNGVVITDDIGMGAVRDMFSDPQTVENMMNATTDLIDLCAYGTDTGRAIEIAEFIERGVNEGRIDGAAMEASRERIEKLLSELPQYDVTRLPEDVFVRHAGLAPLHDAATTGAGTWQPKK